VHNGGDAHVEIESNTSDVQVQPPVIPTSPILLRRSSRTRQSSTRYPSDQYVLLTDEGEPESFEEAMGDEHRQKWIEVMQDEMKALHDNKTFELMKLPKGKRALENKWVFRMKQEQHNRQPRFKATLVVKGYNQRKGINFDEIFSPAVKITSIHIVLGLAASLDLEVKHMDVETAFVYGDLDEEIYIE